jgi:signal-transduction protein with cAMP-binding, CBS, and nucleotidyltransferase domain
MIIKKIKYPLEHEKHTKLIFQIQQENIKLQFGTVFLKKGTRIPEKGFTKHPEHEISIIQKGKIEMLNEDGSVKGYLKTGDVVSINALEAQAGNVLEDTQLMYTLIK